LSIQLVESESLLNIGKHSNRTKQCLDSAELSNGLVNPHFVFCFLLKFQVKLFSRNLKKCTDVHCMQFANFSQQCISLSFCPTFTQFHCNFDVHLRCLQSLQNAPARLVSDARHHDHTTPRRSSRHFIGCQSVSARVTFKMAVLVWKCLHGVAPRDLADLCVPTAATAGRRQSRSAVSGTLSHGALDHDIDWST